MYRFDPKKGVIECDSPKEVLGLISEIETLRGEKGLGLPLLQRRKGRPPKEGKNGQDETRKEVVFLEAVIEAGDKGSDDEPILRKLNLKGARGFGSVIRAIKNRLEGTNISYDEVVTKQPPNGSVPARWLAKGRAKEALEIIKQHK